MNDNYGIPEHYADFGHRYPMEGIQILKSSALLCANIPSNFGGGGLGEESGNAKLLDILKTIGSYDLSLGRIYEGHLNALLLISRHASQRQKELFFKEAQRGKLFGIWNSEMPSEPLRYKRAGGKFELTGAKVFCSGATNIDRPIVTADGKEGTYMTVLEMDKLQLKEDMTYWKPMGMKSSVSCRFDFTGVSVTDDKIVGEPYAYVGEPDFTAGAARFAAVQLGGAEAAIRTTVCHLQKLDRSAAPEQAHRLGKLAMLRETGRMWTKNIGKTLDERYNSSSVSLYQVNMYRTIAREICEKVLSLCEMSVGLQGMMQPHALERIHRDLTVY
ncbi:MAG: acyl-CoA dehydrogenase family protein [Pricia sp.]